MDQIQPPPRAVIFDLGDVLFAWSAKTTTSIPAKTLREILSTPIWYSYDRGEITRDVCYRLSSEKFSFSVSEIAEAFAQARESLQPNPDVIAFIRELKQDASVRVYAMSNIGKEDYEGLLEKMDCALFDRVFTSAAAGMRKPESRFYHYVSDQVGLTASQIVFIDDRKDNIQAAQALGIHAFVFDESIVRALRHIFDNPAAKGWRWLFQNAKHCNSITDNGIAFADNFAKLLIVDTLPDTSPGGRSLVDLSWGSKKTWNFFTEEAVLVPGGVFPDDLDTTSLALKVLRPPSDKTMSSLLDTMAELVNHDGTFQTYFDLDRPRVDPIVSANILACYYSYGRGKEFENTLQLLHSMLLKRSYVAGTRYYTTADCCLGFIARLLRCSSDMHLHLTLGPLLKSRLRERVGQDGSALDLAMRIIACTQMGIACGHDRSELLRRQCQDGSWEQGWMYRYGSTGVQIGNRAVTTAMAVAALSTQPLTTPGEIDKGGELNVNGMSGRAGNNGVNGHVRAMVVMVFIVTGGYAGVGFELCKILYTHNANVWVAGRSESKAQKAIAAIKEGSPHSSGSVSFLSLDLSNLATIKPAVEAFTAQSQRLDVLVNNAGVMYPPEGSLDAHGNDLQVGTNCLGPYLLYQLLLPILTKTAASAPTASVRVAWAGSIAVHVAAPKPHGIILEGNGKPTNQGIKSNYAQTKVGNAFLARECAKSTAQTGVVHVAFNPGNIRTELQRHWTGIDHWITDNFILYEATYGAYTELFAILTPELTPNKTGAYVYPWGRFGPLPVGIEDSLKTESEGGSGVSAKFLAWCDEQTKVYL
ncbi:Short-chain dehydrogenase/reductase [Paramyrothecium foliicola]|nr:Short-chain dehydrogenase/reductase [Paramyrothecium foliicola]